jgi:tetratricopeptide (TPR) repeat protein
MISASKTLWAVPAVVLSPLLVGIVFAAPPDSPRRIAVLVGINAYENRNLDNLEFAERDVEGLAKLLDNSYQVELLLGSAPRNSAQSPTKENLERTIKKVLALGLTKNDTVLLAFAGHGEQIAAKRENGQTRSEPFYCPKDAIPNQPSTMLNLSELIEDLAAKGGGTNLLLVDACRNDPDPTRGRGIDGDMVLSLPKGMAIFFSCSKGEKAQETRKLGGGHGLFFHFVLEGLRSDETRNEDGEVTWEQLVPFVKRKVQREGPRLLGATIKQTPHTLANLGLSPVILDAESAFFPKEEDVRKRVLAFNDLTADERIKEEVQALCEKPAHAKKIIAVVAKMAKQKDHPIKFGGALVLANAALLLQDPEAGEILYQVCADQAVKLESSEKLAQAYTGITAVLQKYYQDQKYDKSAQLAQRFLESLERQQAKQAFKDAVQRHLIQSVFKQGESEKATRMLNDLVKERGTDWRNRELKAWLEKEKGHVDEAISAYKGVFSSIAEDKALTQDDRINEQNRIRYGLSALYMELDQVDRATDELKALLAQDPNSPTFNNDLGFIWADHDMNLDEAERLIRKALEEDRKQRKADTSLRPELDKDNPAYFDSLGWVLFKKKKYQEAKTYLLQANKDTDGQYIEILAHLGDAHLMLGEKAEAIAVWKKALQLKPTTKHEEQKKAAVEQKLRAN